MFRRLLSWYVEGEGYIGTIYMGQSRGRTPILRSSIPSPVPGLEHQYKVMFIDHSSWREAHIILKKVY